MKDLRGQTFNYLTAISPTKEREKGSRYVIWDCVCLCGKKVKVASARLTKGVVKSCGCHPGARPRDLSGQTFGHLTAISWTEERKDRSVVWECKCSCGKRAKASAVDLRRGRAKHCGCYPKGKIKDLRGQTFGHLTVISLTEERMGSNVVWECECICGERTKVSSEHLRIGRLKSCGCPGVSSRDLRGQTFGHFTAISSTEERIRGSVVWECECSCGEKIKLSSAVLKRRPTKGCGCCAGRKSADLSD